MSDEPPGNMDNVKTTEGTAPKVEECLDPELDALLNDAIKEFSPASESFGTANTSTRPKESKKSQKSKKDPKGLGSNPVNMEDFEAELRKLLSHEAAELGDLLASEFEKAMNDPTSRVYCLVIFHPIFHILQERVHSTFRFFYIKFANCTVKQKCTPKTYFTSFFSQICCRMRLAEWFFSKNSFCY